MQIGKTWYDNYFSRCYLPRNKKVLDIMYSYKKGVLTKSNQYCYTIAKYLLRTIEIMITNCSRIN